MNDSMYSSGCLLYSIKAKKNSQKQPVFRLIRSYYFSYLSLVQSYSPRTTSMSLAFISLHFLPSSSHSKKQCAAERTYLSLIRTPPHQGIFSELETIAAYHGKFSGFSDCSKFIPRFGGIKPFLGTTSSSGNKLLGKTSDENATHFEIPLLFNTAVKLLGTWIA